MTNDSDDRRQLVNPTFSKKHPARIRRIVGAAILLGLGLAFVGGWFWFNMIPTEADLRRHLADADEVELCEFRPDGSARWVKLTDRAAWMPIAESLHYQQTFWQFSNEPKQALAIETFQQGRRAVIWDYRDDGCIHIRKARWYRMPVSAEFPMMLRKILDAHGEDLPKGKLKPQNR